MGHRSEEQARSWVAQEAARIMIEEGVRDYHIAKHKAMSRLGLSERTALPRNAEIEQAIRSHRELFFTEQDRRHDTALWRAALSAMRFLSPFEPKLVGPVLLGTAGRHSVVNLHVYADTVEEVLFHFMDARVRFRSIERKLRFGKETHELYPCVVFEQGGAEIEAIVLSWRHQRRAPLSSVDGRPMRRADTREVATRVQGLGE